jgi:hypothetical protein
MFSRKQTSSTDLRGPIRASNHGTNLRGAALVLSSLLMVLLACAAPACRANTNNNTGNDGKVNTDVNAATNTPPITPPATSEVAGDSSAAGSGGTPALISSDFLTPFNDPASIHLKSNRKSGDPALSAKCFLIPGGFCGALKNKQIVILGAIQTAALISDGVTTRQYLSRGYTEVEPVARILIGSKPTWGRMAPIGAVQVFAGMWLAERMSTSQHVWIRRFWWLPQMLGTAGNVAASLHNLPLHR